MDKMTDQILTPEHSAGADEIAEVFVDNFEPTEAIGVAIMVLRRLAFRANVERPEVSQCPKV